MHNINVAMTNLCCSVCFSDDRRLTQVAGTVICKECLKVAVEKYKSNDDNLVQNVENVITKDDDIYT